MHARLSPRKAYASIVATRVTPLRIIMGEAAMPVGTDELLAELNLLMERFDNQPEDLHELHFRVVELMNRLRAINAPVPEDLRRFADEIQEEVERADVAPGS
jgi:hypothetical protein